MSTSAIHLSSPRNAPLPLDEQVREIIARVDWDAALPARAFTFSWRAQAAVKRVLDIVLSAAALVVLSPFLAVIAILVKLTSHGPVLYEWTVLGYRGREFKGYKFRSMVVDADALKVLYLHHNEMRGPAFKLRADPRITRFGRWMRKFSVDELPQLWSVLKGDMSLVGPRPPYASEFVDFEDWQHGKLSVIPGITCIWQVSGRSDISDFADWAKLDLEYIQKWNLWLDFKILLRTIPAVLSARGAY